MVVPRMAPSFDTPEAELAHYRGLAKTLEEDLEDTKLALEEFRASAGELEKELEKELALAEKQLKASQGREDGLRADVDVWKVRSSQRARVTSLTGREGRTSTRPGSGSIRRR